MANKGKSALDQQVRVLVANIYDLQKLRISAGNRLVSSFYIRQGIEPSEKKDKDLKDEEKEKERDKFLDVLMKDYKNITSCIKENVVTPKSAVKKLVSDGVLTAIRDDSDYKLVDAYNNLIKAEELQVKELDKLVKQHPLYEAFFKHVKGCGTLMSGICLAYLDPEEAKYVSSFFKYAGLDSVPDKDKDGNYIYITDNDDAVKVIKKVYYQMEDGSEYDGDITKVKATSQEDPYGNQIYLSEEGDKLTQEYAVTGEGKQIYTVIETGEEYVGDVINSEHGRRKGDVIDMVYKDKDGNMRSKKSITYNPVLKTKLMGVLSGCLIKAKDPVYDKIYRDYKRRLENDPRKASYTKLHKDNMAKRYMIKQFLRNLWVTWRALEGFEVNEPYEVAKLGRKPHAYNEYQYNIAKKQSEDGTVTIKYTGTPNEYEYYANYVDKLSHTA